MRAILHVSAHASRTCTPFRGFSRHDPLTEDYDPSFANALLAGTVERVGALVSRLQGTFEFEVQPLREYFAGRYLYKTAPYSPQGLGRFGTKPDRFDALARNSYWTNVTRFFCGFYDVGELLTLVDGLLQLDEEPRFGLTNQTRQLAMMLLADHVFSQAPRAMKRLVAYVIREPGLRRLTAGAETQRAMALPQSAGGGIMFSAAKAQLQTETDPVRRGVFRRLMGRNASWETLKREWIERLGGNVMDCDPLWEAWDFGIVDRFSPTEIEVFGYRVRD